MVVRVHWDQQIIHAKNIDFLCPILYLRIIFLYFLPKFFLLLFVRMRRVGILLTVSNSSHQLAHKECGEKECFGFYFSWNEKQFQNLQVTGHNCVVQVFMFFELLQIIALDRKILFLRVPFDFKLCRAIEGFWNYTIANLDELLFLLDGFFLFLIKPGK